MQEHLQSEAELKKTYNTKIISEPGLTGSIANLIAHIDVTESTPEKSLFSYIQTITVWD